MATPVGAAAAREQVWAALDAIDAAHALIRATSTDLVGNDFRVDIADRLEAQERINRGLMYRIFGELADPPDGSGSIAAVRAAVWTRLRITPREITRRCRLAARIRTQRSLTGATIPPELPVLATAIEAGSIGDDHIRAICQAVDVLPASVPPAQIAAAEAALVSHATGVDAGVLSKIGQRIADHLNPDGLFSDRDRARRRTLTLGRQGPDGMSKLTGLLDPGTRAYFEAITAAVRPGRHLPDTDKGPAADSRTPAQRCHDALRLALSTAIASGKLGTHRGHPVTVVVTTSLTELNQAAHAANDPNIAMPPPALTGGGSRLPMRDLISLAAQSIHYLAVFDDHTARPLFLGRQKRVATADQRLICYARDRGCTHPHCRAPGYHCEVHHAQPWSPRGRTNTDNLYFACSPHHTDVTQGRQHTTVTSGRLSWTDGTGPPRINHAHHPEELLRGGTDPPDGTGA
ncbi:HNH nuclease [Mycolicibacter minnesotensis]|uniref:HNH nuclease n=1 Tax=Mycolicibacter minnesotensis TaxID=1118379 RepID=A0A7I7RAY0_9MYCO|nr:HNH endonuclease signature motif containing protein [Mycolicibacter minnesotensis]ORB04604.1 HNH nuclease [Mycolicibacter minnesotensis]BBY35230.1 hypothetical protein MMIN_32910 [Mycolicibacter minnesotensis]